MDVLGQCKKHVYPIEVLALCMDWQSVSSIFADDMPCQPRNSAPELFLPSGPQSLPPRDGTSAVLCCRFDPLSSQHPPLTPGFMLACIAMRNSDTR